MGRGALCDQPVRKFNTTLILKVNPFNVAYAVSHYKFLNFSVINSAFSFCFAIFSTLSKFSFNVFKKRIQFL